MSEKKFTKVQIEIEKEILFNLFMLAHNRNITLNKLVNDILEEYINDMEMEEKHIKKSKYGFYFYKDAGIVADKFKEAAQKDQHK